MTTILQTQVPPENRRGVLTTVEYADRSVVYEVLSDKKVIAFVAQYDIELLTIDIRKVVPEIIVAFPEDVEFATAASEAKTFQELARVIVKTPEHAQSPMGLLLSKITGIPPLMLDYIAEPYKDDVLESWWF